MPRKKRELTENKDFDIDKMTDEVDDEGIDEMPDQEQYKGQPQMQMQSTQEANDDRPVSNVKSILGKQAIGVAEIEKATEIFKKYKDGKTNLDRKIIENEQWYKLRHWGQLKEDANQRTVEPTSAWLFNSIMNKHADAMDNFPAPNVLPREASDKSEAKTLTSIIPVILDENDFEKTYSDVWNYKLTKGTGVYGVFWDSSKLNSLGDISIKKCDLLNLAWQPGVNNIQDSQHFFATELVDNEILEEQYPDLKGTLGGSNDTIAKYIYDDTVDTSDKSLVIDWYYHKYQNGKKVLHLCKYVNDTVLFATENDTEVPMDEEGNPIGQSMAERGIYDHGKYPFVFDPLFVAEGTPCGFSYIDVGKSCQEAIDRLNKSILENAYINAKPRFFYRNDGNINIEEYADLTNDFIEYSGSDLQADIMPIQSTGLGEIYVSVLNNKIEELKETTGNRDVSTGGTAGVTAASAISALQEAGSKLSRDANKQSYRAFRELITIVIELIRQFYDTTRYFRIVGESGADEFIAYNNQNIAPQEQGSDFGVEMGYRVPAFDIQVVAEKQSPYSKLSQNELALQFYGAGFFNPQMSDQALACMEMMDFDRKDFIMQRISQNGTMYQQMMQMQELMNVMRQQLAELTGADPLGMSAMPMTNNAEEGPQNQMSANKIEALGDTAGDEPTINRKAKERVANSTNPT